MASPASRPDPARSPDAPSTSSTPHTPRTPGTVFHERLLPGAGGWFGVVVFALVLGVALSVVSSVAAVVTGLVALVVGAGLAWLYSPVVAVRDGELVAGRAHIPLDLLGEVTVLDRDGVQRAMGTQWDPRAFACLRTWAGGGVRVEVVDPSDPTPYWIVSSRRAHDLATALTVQR